MDNSAGKNDKKKKKIKAVKSVLDPDETFFYHKGKHIATLKLSDKDGKLGISFKFEDSDKK